MLGTNPPERTVEQEFIVRNLVKIAQHHKKHCHGESCDMCLSAIAMVCGMANIHLTHKEEESFY